MALRSYIKRQCRRLGEAGVHLIVQPALRRHISSISHNVLILGVYRYDNATILDRIAKEAENCHWKMRLWALDRIHPLLACYSVGAGKSPKFSLLNRLIRETDLAEFDWTIVTDDDLRFEYGSLNAFLALADKAGMDIAQPAHALGSYVNHRFTVRNPLAIARLTTFVEIGPLFAIKRSHYNRFLPFPENVGMGWGLDVEWSDLQTQGARFGIVDWVTLRHLHPLARDYDAGEELKRLQELLKARGHQSVDDLQKTVATWHVWEGSPPWLRSSK